MNNDSGGTDAGGDEEVGGGPPGTAPSDWPSTISIGAAEDEGSGPPAEADVVAGAALPPKTEKGLPSAVGSRPNLNWCCTGGGGLLLFLSCCCWEWEGNLVCR